MVAFSSGNHAQGVAAAAALLGIKAVIVMPTDAPAIKLANTRGYGAEVVLYDRAREDREAIADKLATDRGAAIVRPFDDPDIIAGQGTVGREIYRQSRATARRSRRRLDSRRRRRPDLRLEPGPEGRLAVPAHLCLRARRL